MERSMAPVKSVHPSDEKATAITEVLLGEAEVSRRTRPVLTSQTHSLPSAPPAATIEPSALKAPISTRLLRSSCRRGVQPVDSRIQIDPSWPQVKSRVPSAENFTPWMPSD